MNSEIRNNETIASRIVFSRWWVVVLVGVVIYGFATLITVTYKAYADKPPIPERVTDHNGRVLFTGDDIRAGQELFLSRGLMDNGSIWGHGAYLGPDFSALTLHRLALNYAEDYHDEARRISVARQNRYNAANGDLVFTPTETRTFNEAPAYWLEYFSDPAKNGGLKAGLISDKKELRQLSAYFAWAAWATVATRPGTDASYTNNFPAEPLVGNAPTGSTAVWSIASLLFLLFGIGGCLYFIGRHPQDSWNPMALPSHEYISDGQTPPSIRALLKFCLAVGVLFLGQTLVGGALAHYRADPSSFYGWDMSSLWPSSLMRTWHLQMAIFWIATGFVTGGLVISRILGGREWDGIKVLTNILFFAFVAVILGALLCCWGGAAGLWDKWTFWLGSQGWEYIELGRAWQYALIVGLCVWVVILAKNLIPAFRRISTRPLAVIFMIAAVAIPVFYLPAVFFDGSTNFTVVDTWRFWVIHLWVEGFFELFATVMVALIFIEMGLINSSLGMRIIFLEFILTLMGGVIGTGHHWYFEGQTEFNMAVSSCFSALEVVPLVLLCVEASGFMRAARHGGLPGVAYNHRWTLNYFMAVGFWNFVGAGVFGFLINTPLVSYYEIGTMLTPNHGHTAMFGVFGFLALGLCVFVMRKNLDDEHWKPVMRWVRVAFWGLNIGLALMVVLSMLPGGFVQLFDSFQNGYWHARSIEFTNSPLMARLGWLRIIGDLVFILFGAFPFAWAALKAWLAASK
ncbi:MAG: cbb3-type cytochrome c oxidase subunit I [Clostridium sp.]|nr:cbb3-type cytochrome c oxidase subunit I [Clostridium sp.]